MVVPPAFAETKIAIAKRAGERNLADIGQASGRSIERRRARLEHGARARHFAGLMVEPFLLVMLACTPSRLVYCEDRSIENAVAQRLQPQRREPCRWRAWNDPAATGAFVEKFEDDARVVIGGTVFR